MSQFAGYIIPGSLFIAFGLKWSLDATENPIYSAAESDSSCQDSRGNGQFRSQRGKRRNLTSSSSSSCCCSCSLNNRYPLEGILKLVITSIGIVVTVIAAHPNGQLQFIGDILYATVYLFFAISGLVDVLVFYCNMPYGLEKFALALAFLIEGLIFNLHLKNQSFMESHIHVLLVIAIYACALSSLLEIVLPWNIVKCSRAFFTLVHGSWYIQSGFILYNPSQNSKVSWTTGESFNSELVWISLLFAWHCAGAFIILVIIISLTRKRKSHPDVPQIEAATTLEREPNSSVHHQCQFCSISSFS